jgi:hypothetical protein
MKQTLNEEIKRIHQMMGIENKLITEGNIIDDIILLVSRNVDDIRVSDNQLANVLQRLKSTSPSQLTTAERRILVGAIQNNLAFDKYTLQAVFDSWQTQFTEAKNVNDVVALMLNSTDSQGKKFIENIQSGSLQFNDFLNSYFGDAAPAVRRSVANAMPGKNFTDPMNLKKWSDNLLAKMSDSLDFDVEDIVSQGNDYLTELRSWVKSQGIETPKQFGPNFEWWWGWFTKRLIGFPQLNGTTVGRAIMHPDVRDMVAGKNKKEILNYVQEQARLFRKDPKNSEINEFLVQPGLYGLYKGLTGKQKMGFWLALYGYQTVWAALLIVSGLLAVGTDALNLLNELISNTNQKVAGGVSKLSREDEDKIKGAIMIIDPSFGTNEGTWNENYSLEYSNDGQEVFVFDAEFNEKGKFRKDEINDKLIQ